MGDTAELLKLITQQMQQQAQQHKEDKERQQQQMEMQAQRLQQQMEMQAQQHKEEMEQQRKLMDLQTKQYQADKEQQSLHHQQQLDVMMEVIRDPAGAGVATTTVSSAIPPFEAFDASSELWPDYWSRFQTFVSANAVPDQRRPQVFLTNQDNTVYRQLSTLATQMSPPREINSLTLDEIVNFMKEQFDPKRFTVRERFKFWSDMQRKPGETLQELAARIRQDAATCDFPSIKDPQDEALRQRFICSVNNEAVLKALFKIKDDDLTFAKAVHIATETEDAAKVAKETVFGSKPRPVHKLRARDIKSSKSPRQAHPRVSVVVKTTRLQNAGSKTLTVTGAKSRDT